MRTPKGQGKVQNTCQSCGEKFETFKCKTRPCCSRKCAGILQARRYFGARKLVVCAQCGKEFAVSHHRETTAKYCSFLCGNRAKSKAYGPTRGNLLRGSGEGKTYIKFHNRHLHRVLAEQKIGRSLEPGEVVHHADGNKRNNALENLVVLKHQGEHARIHHTKNRKCTITGCGRKHVAKGLCERHYGQRRRGAGLTPSLG